MQTGLFLFLISESKTCSVEIVIETPKLFQEISDLDQKAEILSFLARDLSDIKARVEYSFNYVLRSQEWNPPFRLEVMSAEPIRFGSRPVTVQFDSRGDRYFAKVDVVEQNHKVYFVFVNPIYKFQRRQHRRLRIPKRFNNQAFLMRANDQLWNEQCELIDLSDGGCSLRLSYAALDIAHSAVVLMDLRLGAVPSFMQIGKVCYKKSEKHLSRSVIRVGIQFQKHPKSDAFLKAAMAAVSVDIFESWFQRS